MRDLLDNRRTSSNGLSACTCALLGLFILSCGDTVIDPFENESKYFTVYGYLNEQVYSQVLRVIPVTRRDATVLDPSDPNAVIDAVVTTTDISSGQVTYWNHNLEELSDGTYAHIYRASFNILAGRSYRLEIVRNDGKMTSAETVVPSLSSARVEVGDRYMNDLEQPVQDLILPGVNSPWNIKVIYRFPFPVYLPYGRTGQAEGDNNWRVTVDFNRDVNELAQILGIPPDLVSWSAMGVQVEMLDQKWDPPTDVFDPEILAQPDALTNVVNGHGFFGSVALLQDTWPSER